jgi:hypothetical protein
MTGMWADTWQMGQKKAHVVHMGGKRNILY